MAFCGSARSRGRKGARATTPAALRTGLARRAEMPGGGRGEGRVRERTKLVWLPADADLWLDRLIAA